MSVNNIFQNVQLWRVLDAAESGWLLNSHWYVSHTNRKFDGFDKDFKGYNLGSVITFDRIPSTITTRSLTPVATPMEAPKLSLAIDNFSSNTLSFSTFESIFYPIDVVNSLTSEDLDDSFIDNYLKKQLPSGSLSILTDVEKDIATKYSDNCYRFYGSPIANGINGAGLINTFTELATATTRFRLTGVTQGANIEAVLPEGVENAIIGSGLSQFALRRNDDLAESWFLGMYKNVEYGFSNLCPLHYSGNVGNNDTVLTVVSTNDNTGANITQITCTSAGAPNDPDAVKANDFFEFLNGVGGLPNVQRVTFLGKYPQPVPTQFRVSVDAATSGGTIVLNLKEPLRAIGLNKNISTNIVAGMQLRALRDHRIGLMISGNPLYFAMPSKYPDGIQFPTHTWDTKDTEISLYRSIGRDWNTQQSQVFTQAIWGAASENLNIMGLIFPVSY